MRAAEKQKNADTLKDAQEASSADSAQSTAVQQAELKRVNFELTATFWLRSHGGTPDELAELRQENPNAYAIVKALLTKRSLGLLDSKHPTASFANEDGSPVSHAQLALTAKKSVVNYAGAQPATHHDWFNWKGGEMDDESMVENVLGENAVENVVGAVAELKGKRAAQLKLHSLGFTQEYTSTVSAQGKARMWLDSHAGSPDELAELKSANPQAYEIVKVLLAKRAQKIQEANEAKNLALLASKRKVMDEKIKEAQSRNPKLMSWIDTAEKTSSSAAKAPTGHTRASATSNPYLLDLND